MAVAQLTGGVGECLPVVGPNGNGRSLPGNFHGREAIISNAAAGVNQPSDRARNQRDSQAGEQHMRLRPRFGSRWRWSGADRLNSASAFRQPVTNLAELAIQIASGIVA